MSTTTSMSLGRTSTRRPSIGQTSTATHGGMSRTANVRRDNKDVCTRSAKQSRGIPHAPSTAAKARARLRSLTFKRTSTSTTKPNSKPTNARPIMLGTSGWSGHPAVRRARRLDDDREAERPRVPCPVLPSPGIRAREGGRVERGLTRRAPGEPEGRRSAGGPLRRATSRAARHLARRPVRSDRAARPISWQFTPGRPSPTGGRGGGRARPGSRPPESGNPRPPPPDRSRRRRDRPPGPRSPRPAAGSRRWRC